jgi:hypothetical protein
MRFPDDVRCILHRQSFYRQGLFLLTSWKCAALTLIAFTDTGAEAIYLSQKRGDTWGLYARHNRRLSRDMDYVFV